MYRWLLVFTILFSCSKDDGKVVEIFSNPANEIGSESNLHLDQNGRILLSWIEAKKGANSKLLFSTLNETTLTWSSPTLIAEGKDWFVNWADFPSLTSFGSNSLAAHYLDKSADDTYAYDVKLSISNDDGKTWNDALIPHKDNTPTEHGFVSKVAVDDNSFLSLWLDGRQYAYADQDSTISKEMTLRSAQIDANGNISQEVLLDARVCDCCQTDATMTSQGPIVVYRDRSENDIRDIYFTAYRDNKWSLPRTIHNDDWEITGCPVNGPAISAKQSTVVVAWFTVADDIPRVKIAFSTDAGNTFESPVLVDELNTLGRVDIEMINNNSAFITWMNTEKGNTQIQAQIINSDHTKSEIITISESSESRSSGFPRLAVKNDKAYLSWTSVGDELSIKTAVVYLNNIK